MRSSLRGAFVFALLVVFALAPAGPSAWSQATRTIKLVVPYPPGSGPDILSRLMAEQIGRGRKDRRW